MVAGVGWGVESYLLRVVPDLKGLTFSNTFCPRRPGFPQHDS